MADLLLRFYFIIMKALILGLFLVSITPLFSQSVYFNQVIRTSAAEQMVGILEDSLFYYAVGHQSDSITYKQKAFLYFLDKTGFLIQKKTKGNDIKEYSAAGSKGILKLPDGSIMICGGMKDSAMLGGQNIVSGYLIKLDFNGDSVWEKVYIDTMSTGGLSYMGISDLCETFDKGFILSGFISGNTNAEIKVFLLKTDSLGNQQWMKNYGTNGIQFRGYTLDVTPDSGYVVTGWNDDGYDYDSWILKTDKYGTVQWQKVLGGQYDDFINAACITPDGNIVVVLNEQFQDAGSLHMKIKVIKYSISGNVIWIKPYIFNQSINCTSILALDDNSFVLVGETYIFDSVLQVNGLPAYIYKLDANGDSLWLRYLEYKSFYLPGITNQHFAIDMIRTSDGGFLVCGDYREYQPTMLPQSSWLVKLDSLGCDTPGCQYIGVNELEIKNEKLEIFPNPFGEEIYVTLPEEFGGGMLVMYDVQGRRAVETEVPEIYGQQSFTVQTGHLKPGVYLVELAGKDGRVWRRKVVKH